MTERTEFTEAELAMLKEHYDMLHLINPSSASGKKLFAVLDVATTPMLQQLWSADIKFVSMLARSRLIRRGVKV
jgi:hypothetical protein